jgi:hypothetical protein
MKQPTPPCKDCLIIPICRNRELIDILHNCDKAYAYLFFNDDTEKISRKVIKLYEVVKSNYAIIKWVTVYPMLYEDIQIEIRARDMTKICSEEILKMR